MMSRIRLAAIVLNLSLLVAGVAGGALLFTSMNDQRANTLQQAARPGIEQRIDWQRQGKPPLDFSGLLGNLGPRDPDPETDTTKELRELIEEYVWLRRIAEGPGCTLASVWCDGRNHLLAPGEKFSFGPTTLMLASIEDGQITVTAATRSESARIELGYRSGALPWTPEPYYGPCGPDYPPEIIDDWEGPIKCPRPQPKRTESIIES